MCDNIQTLISKQKQKQKNKKQKEKLFLKEK